MLITKELLYKHEACKAQLDKFVELFPDGVAPTRELCLAHAQTFNFGWARCLLPCRASKVYDEAIAPASKAYYKAIAVASKAYYEAIAPASKAYYEAIAVASKAYYEAIAPASKAYDEALAPASKAYDEAIAPARKAYDEALAYAWFDASQMEARSVTNDNTS